MRTRHSHPFCHRLVCAWMLAAAGLAAACAKAPPVPPAPAPPAVTIAAGPDAAVTARMTIAASADTNPDATGRPSPVVVRIYQLRNDAAFMRAAFFDLFDDEEKALGQELITRDEYMMAPSESETIEVAVSSEARFVGAIAAFRDIRNAEWRDIVSAPRGGLTVTIERARVRLTAVPDSQQLP